MEKDFLNYDLSLRMNQLGYKKEGVDEECFAFYDEEEYLFTVREQDDIDEEWLIAPTFSQAFRFFREKYGLSGWVDESFGGSLRRGVVSIKSEIGSEFYPTTTKLFYTYEEAELDCLTNLIEIVEQNKSE
jgi:hypothetical protein